MLFDFCVGEPAASGAPCGLDTIFLIWGDATYQTPRKMVTPGKTYLVLTSHGQGCLRYDDHVFHVKRGDFLLMRPHENFSYGCEKDAWYFWWFELCSPQSYLETEIIHQVVLSDFLLQLFSNSMAYAKRGCWDIAQSLLLSALAIIAQSNDGGEKQSHWAAKIETYIRENLDTVTVSLLCDHLGLTERTFRNLCHKAYDCAPKQLISRYRLDTAQQLLANTTTPLARIASMLGFSSPFHFSRSFKNYFHIPPSEYRRHSRG